MLRDVGVELDRDGHGSAQIVFTEEYTGRPLVLVHYEQDYFHPMAVVVSEITTKGCTLIVRYLGRGRPPNRVTLWWEAVVLGVPYW